MYQSFLPSLNIEIFIHFALYFTIDKPIAGCLEISGQFWAYFLAGHWDILFV